MKNRDIKMNVAPPIDFPLEEVLKRVVTIQKSAKLFIKSAIELQKKLKITRDITDEDEIKLMEKADHEMGDMIINIIESYFPLDSLICEGVIDRKSTGQFRWVLDPVDGTMNFVRGIPLYAISIGIEHRETPVAGVVIIPALGDVYVATLGGGATKNGEKLTVSQTSMLGNAVLMFSFPTRRKRIMNELINDLTTIATYGRSIRRSGSIVLDLCWLAEGLIDGLWDKSTPLYDTSATSVILKEAGGSITDFKGNVFLPGQSEVVASNAVIHKQLIKALSQNSQNRN